jgi:hypothetical protein
MVKPTRMRYELAPNFCGFMPILATKTVVGTKLVLAQMFLVLATKTEIASAA